MTATLERKASTFKRIINNLWILVSFIPLVNGMGIIYVGAKTSNRSVIKEGLVFEIPWVLLFFASGIVNLNKSFSDKSFFGIAGIISLFIVISIILSIIKSNLIAPKYERLLEEGKCRKSINKVVSLAGLIITFIPFINGIPFIYLGLRYSDKNFKIEGAIYEIFWILSIFTAALTSFFIEFALALQIISIARFIILNYKSDYLSFGFESYSTRHNQENSKPNYSSPHKKENFDVKEETIKEPQNEVYGHYRTIINDLTKEYKIKEDKVCKLISERFENSRITYERFMGMINNSNENFYSQRNIALDIIELSSEDIILEDNIKQKISFLELLISKIGDLQAELIINNVENKKSDKELKELIEDMEVLIDSVKDYK